MYLQILDSILLYGNDSGVSLFFQVMKCLWRVIKTLPKWMEEEGDGSVNLDDVLADVHEFLKTYPSTFWRKKDNDTPVR